MTLLANCKMLLGGGESYRFPSHTKEIVDLIPLLESSRSSVKASIVTSSAAAIAAPTVLGTASRPLTNFKRLHWVMAVFCTPWAGRRVVLDTMMAVKSKSCKGKQVFFNVELNRRNLSFSFLRRVASVYLFYSEWVGCDSRCLSPVLLP